MTGAVASERVTEACDGGPDRRKSIVEWKGISPLTARLTSRAETKVGHSDPVVPRGRAIAQRIKGTPGITG